MSKGILTLIFVFTVIALLNAQPSKQNTTFWEAVLSDSTQLRLTYAQKGNHFKLHSRPGAQKLFWEENIFLPGWLEKSRLIRLKSPVR
ncbi:MAG: hypothetical protein HC830_09645 [Bacteroidetes bacterium]|nr:hypothetical protein [Bacteroidales bacterium]NJO69497.1 hypothetical protein [Bacteroidota bacterium]